MQTDLLGPVDFKVLTETGRTRHILEEGMLGHRYAFLDEIFDGRDMLLRAVLNALHERELKQGPSVAAGPPRDARCSPATASSPRWWPGFRSCSWPSPTASPSAPSSHRASPGRRAAARSSRARSGRARRRWRSRFPGPGSRGSRRCCPRWRFPRRCWAPSSGWWTCSSRRWRRTPPVSRGPASSRSGRWCARCGRCGRRWCATPAAVTVRSGRPPRISGRSRSSSPPPVRRETGWRR